MAGAAVGDNGVVQGALELVGERQPVSFVELQEDQRVVVPIQVSDRSFLLKESLLLDWVSCFLQLEYPSLRQVLSQRQHEENNIQNLDLDQNLAICSSAVGEVFESRYPWGIKRPLLGPTHSW